MNLYVWAARWKIPLEAVADLQNLIGLDGTPGNDSHVGKSEAFAQSQVVLEAARKGIRLWRNNVGVLEDSRGVPVHFGLANDAKGTNKLIKSSDLIGVRPVLITPELLGCTIGQFVGREIKKPGWKYTGEDREEKQLNFAGLVCSLGGDAAFATGEGTL
jgi:hypothetical protein